MRGYFGIGVEGISKPMNMGGLLRTAHAFGASFVFTVGAVYAKTEGRRSDTSDGPSQVPLFTFDDTCALALPHGCSLVGVELRDDATVLPSFRHPRRAAYVLGPERGSLSPDMVALCDHIVKIPTRFCINLAVAGAVVLYDRLLASGRFADRPLVAGGPVEALPVPRFGEPLWRKKHRRRVRR